MRFGVENIRGKWRVGPLAENGALTKMLATIFEDRAAAEANAERHNRSIKWCHKRGLIPCWTFEQRGGG